MALMMLGEQQLAARPCRSARYAFSAFSRFGFWNSLSLIQSGMAMRNEAKPARRIGEIGFEQPLELDERLLEEDDVVDVVEIDVARLQAIADRVGRESPASCFLRVKRSSCAAATMRPSSTRAAALS